MKNCVLLGLATAVVLCGCASNSKQTKAKPIYERPWIGGHFETVATPRALRTNDHYGKRGALVTLVHKDTPLDKAGLQEMDLVLAVNGKKVKYEKEIFEQINKNGSGTSTLTIYRDGEILEKTVTPGRERFQMQHNFMVAIKLGTRLEIDVWPGPDFNLIALGYEKERTRLDLRDPKVRYAAAQTPKDPKSEWQGMRSEEGWKFWLGPFSIDERKMIVSQEQ